MQQKKQKTANTKKTKQNQVRKQFKLRSHLISHTTKLKLYKLRNSVTI